MVRKNGIDLFRLIGAFFIMILHTSLGELNEVYSENIRLLARWAVPFYFMTSGFFIGTKIDNGNLNFRKIQKNIASLITILIISSLMYLPINFNAGRTSYEIGDMLTGSFFHLWFIGSLLFGYIVIWYLYFIQKSKIIPWLSICFLILGVLADAYDSLFGIILDYPFFRFLLSIPFLYLGIYISKKRFAENKKLVFIGILFLGVMLQVLEMNYFNNSLDNSSSYQFLVGTIICAISLFIFSTMINIKENHLTRWGKDHSLFIYLYHPLTYIFLMSLFNRITPNNLDFILIFFPILGFGITLAASILIKKYLGRIYLILNGEVLAKNLNKKLG